MKKLDGVESAEYILATFQLKIAGRGAKVNRQTIIREVEKIRRLRQENGRIAMVGDGIRLAKVDI